MTPEQFLKFYKDELPAEKQGYGLFYVGGKVGFITWEKMNQIVLKRAKADKPLWERFLQGKYWTMPSATQIPKGFKVTVFRGATLDVCTQVENMTKLAELINYYIASDKDWVLVQGSDKVCPDGIADHKHYTFTCRPAATN